MIAVVDYRAGNGPSVFNALETIQASCKMAKSAEDFDGADGHYFAGRRVRRRNHRVAEGAGTFGGDRGEGAAG